MSGRRSSKEDGSPAGTAGGCSCSVSFRPRGTGAGFFPSRVLMKFSSCSICCSRLGTSEAAVNTNCSACRTSSMEVEPPSASSRVSRRESCRDPECVARSQVASQARELEVCAGQFATRAVTTSRRAHSLAARLARAASVARRYLPQKSRSQASSTHLVRAGFVRTEEFCLWDALIHRRRSGRDGWKLIGPRDAELRLGLKNPCGRDTHVIVLLRAVLISSFSAHPGRLPTTSHRRGKWRRLWRPHRRDAAIVRRHVDRRLLVVWPDSATAGESNVTSRPDEQAGFHSSRLLSCLVQREFTGRRITLARSFLRSAPDNFSTTKTPLARRRCRYAGRQHAADHRGAHDLAGHRSGARSPSTAARSRE